MVPLALGTQTGGSVIRPASFCGIVGYKPSFGLINRHGVKPLSESLDTVGVFARSVKHAGVLAGVLARRPALLNPDPERPPRIGLWRTYEWREASRDCAAALEQAARLAAAAGAEVREAQMPQALSEIDDVHHAIEWFEVTDALAYEMQHYSDRLSQKLRERVEKGRGISAADYERAQRAAQSCRRLMQGVFAQFDVLLAPSAVGEAPKGLESTGNAVFNRGWTLLHLPCVTLPGLRGTRGLPVGVQLVGPLGEDARLLAFAAWMEQELTKV
jgi:amidase